LRVNFCWTLAGNVVYAGCQWGMLVVLAKLGNPAMVGLFALGLATTAPIIAMSGLQLRAIQATDASGTYRFADYLGLRLLTTAGAAVVIASIAAVYHREATFVVLAVGLAKSIESISDIVFGLLQQHERMDRIAVSMMIKGVVSLGVLALVVALTHSVFWGMMATAAAWACVLVFYDLPSGRLVLGLCQGTVPFSSHENWDSPPLMDSPVLAPRFDRRTLLRLARTALPLGVTVMLLSLNANVPRYFVEHHGGEYELGIFAALGYLTVAGYQVVSALGQSATPRLAVYHHEGSRQAFRSLLTRLVLLVGAIGVAGVAAAMVLGPLALRLLYRPEYAEYQTPFIWLVVGGALSYVASVFGFAATARRQIAWQPLVLILTVATTLLSCWLLVPGFGLAGAALATVVSWAVCTAGYAFLCGKGA
jgi:O-antigen/teichoic acid export membrane protein